MNTHPNNKQSDYTVCLGKVLDLKGNWTVSLSQFIYPEPFNDIIPETYVHFMFLSNTRPTTFYGKHRNAFSRFRLITKPSDKHEEKYTLQFMDPWAIDESQPLDALATTIEGRILLKEHRFSSSSQLAETLCTAIETKIRQNCCEQLNDSFSVSYKPHIEKRIKRQTSSEEAVFESKAAEISPVYGLLLTFLFDSPLIAKALRIGYNQVAFGDFKLCPRDAYQKLDGNFFPPKVYLLKEMCLEVPAPYDIKNNKLFLYTDIIEYQHVGNVMSPLLSCIPLKSGDEGGVYEPKHLIPKRVTLSNTKAIRIQVRDDNGLPYEFKNNMSSVVCQLYFKRDKPKLYKPLQNGRTSGDEHERQDYW